MRYIIMAGGDYVRWETPRQLLEIMGEPIIARTIRLLRENGIEDIAISSNNEVFEQFGLPVLKHENYYCTLGYNTSDGQWCNCFYPTDEPTTYLFGDVVYSPEAIKTIIETETDDIMFFGSAPPFSEYFVKPYIEPFCFKVVNTEHLKQAVKDVKSIDAQGRFKREPIAWEVWNVISRGPGGDPNPIDYDSYVHINDYTCDIDNPGEIELIEKIVRGIYLTSPHIAEN